MTKLNIRAGDIPETDQEVEQEIAKIEKRSARKPKNSAKNERQLKLVEPKAPKAPKVKAPKTPKTPAGPQYLTKDLNARGKTLLTPELVVKVFADKAAGMKNPQIAEKYNISQGSVSTVLSGPTWFRNRMVAYGRKTNPTWEYPKRVEKTSEQKAE